MSVYPLIHVKHLASRQHSIEEECFKISPGALATPMMAIAPKINWPLKQF